jgi:hypothetical protein
MAVQQGTAAPAASEAPQTPLPPPCSADEALPGMTWFNRCTKAERSYWLDMAWSDVPADAWAAFKRGVRS